MSLTMRELGLPSQPLAFPSYLQLSSNFYKHSWWHTSHRRLKNVVMVMEWIPRPEALDNQECEDVKSLTTEQEENLRQAFNQIDTAGKGQLMLGGFRELLAAVMDDAEGHGQTDIDEMFHKADKDKNELVSFDEVLQARWGRVWSTALGLEVRR